MKLYFGGTAQGQKECALAECPEARLRAADGAVIMPEDAFHAALIDQFHLLIRHVVEDGGDAEAFAQRLLRENPACVIVADEVGMGVVPIDAGERAWREAVGRALCVLAAHAETVTRVFCGIPLRIKETPPVGE